MRDTEAQTEITCSLDESTCRCVLSDVMDLLGRKYTMDLVCVVAAHEVVRFGDIEAHLPGASTSTLSTRLEELEAAGLIERRRYDEIPPRVEYRLTPDGEDLAARFEPVAAWAADRADEPPV